MKHLREISHKILEDNRTFKFGAYFSLGLSLVFSSIGIEGLKNENEKTQMVGFYPASYCGLVSYLCEKESRK
jgi:hypothetical protein